jgi:hypothetical protein
MDDSIHSKSGEIKTKIIIDKKEGDLKNQLIESLAKSDSKNFRETESAIDYISNLIEFLSESIVVLYEKKILDDNDIRRILKVKE